MKSSFRSVRVALFVVGGIGAAALVNGCSAGPEGSEQTGEGNQDLTRIHIPPLEYPIQTATSSQTDQAGGNICENWYVPVPSPLVQFNCTQGVQYSEQTFGGHTWWGYAFACSQPVVPSWLGGGSGWPAPPPRATGMNIGLSTVAYDTCVGNADPGWELVWLEYTGDGPPIGGSGCKDETCQHVIPHLPQ